MNSKPKNTPIEDCSIQSGEPSKPFPPTTPDPKLAAHTALPSYSLHATRWPNESESEARASVEEAQNLLDRLEAYDLSILAFLWEPDLPFTNNEAERAFRMMKVRLKISDCFRTMEGAQRHARIRSYIVTPRKHGLPVLEYLRRALDGQPFVPQPSVTT